MARKSPDDKTSSAAPPPPPAYSYPPPNMSPNFPLREKQEGPAVAVAALGDGQHRRLHILGATWGGIVVTPQVASMVSDKNEVVVNMHHLHSILTPDPAAGQHKRLALLYQLDGQEGPTLVNIDERHPMSRLAINAALHATPPFPAVVEQLPAPWRSAAFYKSAGNNSTHSAPGVEILSATYGPKRVTMPKVLEALGEFFEGRRGQIRMNNAFFMEDPDTNNKKSWTVFFRFGPAGRVQVVTGWEDGALEVPWSRWA